MILLRKSGRLTCLNTLIYTFSKHGSFVTVKLFASFHLIQMRVDLHEFYVFLDINLL